MFIYIIVLFVGLHFVPASQSYTVQINSIRCSVVVAVFIFAAISWINGFLSKMDSNITDSFIALLCSLEAIGVILTK